MKKISMLNIIIILFSFMCTTTIYAERLNRIRCPYCDEDTINILDDEYGVCQCTSCEGMLLVVNGRVALENGAGMPLRDLYDIEALIEAIENGEFDIDNIDEYVNNYREYLNEDDDGEESYYEENNGTFENYDANEKLDSNNPAYKSALESTKYFLYSKDFKNSEPESDAEFEAYINKKYKKIKKSTVSNISTKSNISSPSNINIATGSQSLKVKIIIPHVIKYYISIESDIYIPQAVLNGEEFTLLDATPIEGFKFLGWSPNKEGKILFASGSPLTLYNFNSNSMPSAKVYDFYAIWERIDEKD